MMDAINRRQQKLDDLKNRMDRAERQILERQHRRLEVAAAAVRHYDVRRMLAGIRRELDARIAALAAQCGRFCCSDEADPESTGGTT